MFVCICKGEDYVGLDVLYGCGVFEIDVLEVMVDLIVKCGVVS